MSRLSYRAEWRRKVRNIFTSKARVEPTSKVWFPRVHTSKILADHLDGDEAWVCLDGPTGVGKTSLGFSYFVKNNIEFSAVLVKQAMTWENFCRDLLTKEKEILYLAGKLEIGIDNALPKVVSTIEFKESELQEKITKLSQTWTELDVLHYLSENKLALIVDDAEKASTTLLPRIADLVKGATSSFIDGVKILIIGSDGIYQRLISSDKSLKERLIEVSLGSYKEKEMSWDLLKQGFNKLGISYPEITPVAREGNRKSPIEERVWAAADGLPKSINLLGRDIAYQAYPKKTLSSMNIIDEANKMLCEHISYYVGDFIELLDLCKRNPVVDTIIRILNDEGIGNIHRMNKLEIKLLKTFLNGEKITLDEIKNALSELITHNFIVYNESPSNKIFVKDPVMAHTFSVVMKEPSSYLKDYAPDYDFNFTVPFSDASSLFDSDPE